MRAEAAMGVRLTTVCHKVFTQGIILHRHRPIGISTPWRLPACRHRHRQVGLAIHPEVGMHTGVAMQLKFSTQPKIRGGRSQVRLMGQPGLHVQSVGAITHRMHRAMGVTLNVTPGKSMLFHLDLVLMSCHMQPCLQLHHHSSSRAMQICTGLP